MPINASQDPRIVYMAICAMAARRNVLPEEIIRRFKEHRINKGMRLEFLQEIYRAEEKLAAMPPMPPPRNMEWLRDVLVWTLFYLSFLAPLVLL